MGKILIIKGADFRANSITENWIYNNYTWGKGGITNPGESSGSVNALMSMVGLPLQQANTPITFRASGGYVFNGYLTADLANPTIHQIEYQEFTGAIPDSLTVPAGKYFQISIKKSDGSNADITEGPQSLLILELI